MTPIMRPLLKPHITRLNGSMGSGTEAGSTTFAASAVTGSADGSGGVAGPCPAAGNVRPKNKASGNSRGQPPAARRERGEETAEASCAAGPV